MRDVIVFFQDPHAEEFEDKEWTFVIENVSPVAFPGICVIMLPPSGEMNVLHWTEVTIFVFALCPLTNYTFFCSGFRVF